MAWRDRNAEVPRITTAGTPRSVELAHRQKAYLVSMAIRSACFVGAIAAALLHVMWLWPILIGAAIVLPYIAVVMANAAKTKGENFTLDDSPFGRPELRGGPQWRAEHQRADEKNDEDGE